MSDERWRTRSWEELKAETQARADRGAYPVFGISPDDARAALAMIKSLDPDEWGAAWITIGDRHAYGPCSVGEANVARDALLAAWRLYTFGRWPVAKSPQKVASAAKARAAFEAYGRLV